MGDIREVKGLWVPIEILQAEELTTTEKMVLAEIYALQPCRASNEYLGQFLNLNKRQIMRIIKILEGKGWIKTTYFSPVNREITTTKNVTSDKSGTTKNVTSSDKSGTTKNVTHYQKCHPASDKSGTTSTKNVTQEYRDNINIEYIENIGENITAPPIECINSISRVEPNNKPVDNLAVVVRFFQDNIHPIPNQVESNDLQDLYREYGTEWCINAIKEAARSRATSIRYIVAILNRWKQTGSREPWKLKKDSIQQESRGKQRLDSALQILEELNEHEQRSTDIEDTGGVSGSVPAQPDGA